jgi:hypothetical protein
MSVRRLTLGAIAGLAGTVVTSALSAAQARLRGRPAVYEPGRMAGRLAGRAGLELNGRERAWAGSLMRWPYGASWGAALGAAPAPRWPLAGLVLGGALLSFELVALPLSGATPPVRKWGREELASDAINAFAYGLGTAAVLAALRRALRPRTVALPKPVHGG